MKIVENISEIKNALDEIENNGAEWITNFLTGDAELERWIKKNQVSIEITPTNVFIFRKRDKCQRLYFISSKSKTLAEDLRRVLSSTNETVITSILDSGDDSSRPLKEIVTKAGFSHYKTLNRILKIQTPKPTRVKNPDFARLEDLPLIAETLEKEFDAFLDNHPDLDEIKAAIENQQIMVVRDKETGKVAAFETFEKKGKTVWGRYLASVEEFRKDLPYGGMVLRVFTAFHSDASRLIGWVAQGRENIMKLNYSCGYKDDVVTDEIFKFN